MAIKEAALRSQVAEYSADAEKLAAGSIKDASGLASYRKLFHITLSFEAVSSYIATSGFRPSLAGPRSLAVRIPLLIALGQISAAQAELRRLLELIAWTIYFTDHKREWIEFSSATSKGFTQNARTPIAYAAHREASFYLEYIDELMRLDKSGLAKCSVEGLKQVHYRLNAVIHPGAIARGTSSSPFDQLSDEAINSFSRLLRDALAHSAIILCAFRPERYAIMPAGPKMHLLHLLTQQQRKTLSKGNFGVPSII